MRPDGGGPDVFVHALDLRGGVSIAVGDRVEYAVAEYEGREKAVDVERLGGPVEAPAPAPAPLADNSSEECPCCLERVRDTALVPCGHILCSHCAGGYKGDMCPCCRQPVAMVMRVYL